MVVPSPAGSRVAVKVVITSSSFTGSGSASSSSFEQDTNNSVVKRIDTNKLNFLIFCDF